MRYYVSFVDSSKYCYSVDKLVVHGSFLYDCWDEFSARLRLLLIRFTCYEEMPFSVSLFRDTYYHSFKKLTYSNNFKFELCQGSDTFSFWLGAHFQSYDKTLNTWKLELNPNKCLPCEFVSELYALLRFYSKQVDVAEFDIAVDMPFSRDSFFLVKDKRKYQCVVNSSVNKTEYLGCRHQHGFVKLYNKQEESNLDYSLTRFEISCTSLHLCDIVDSLPCVYFLSGQIGLVDIDLNDTDKFILKTLILDPSRLLELGRKKRSKMREALKCAFVPVSFDSVCFSRLLASLSDLGKFFAPPVVV